MRKILITGANSYVGTNVEKWLKKEPDKYYVETLDMKNPNWKEYDFSKFDVVFHVAGIAHNSQKKSMKDLYYKINKDLAIETAEKSKANGIKQFLFMSSIIIYGSYEKKITFDTVPRPDSFYGRSKLEAENEIRNLSSDSFKVAIIRPPMIYGHNSKGNYKKISKISKVLPIFFAVHNRRSMIFILNFCEFIKQIIDSQHFGVFYPQNAEFVETSKLMKTIANISGSGLILLPIWTPIVHFLIRHSRYFSKAFDSVYYDKSLSLNLNSYNIYDFETSIRLSEGIEKNEN